MSESLDAAPFFVVLCAFVGLTGLISGFISSTITSIITMPLLATVGMKTGHVRLVIMLSTFMCSGSMVSVDVLLSS